MANKRGFSLTETLVALSIMGMLTGVATVFYRGYTVDTAKKDLKQSGLLFASSVSSCIQASGGWTVTRPDGTAIKPCNATKKTTPKATHEELKAKLNFTCPPEATCLPHETTGGNQSQPKYRYYCLSIEKEVSGQKLQVMARVSRDTPSTYEILCNDNLSSYVKLAIWSCKSSYGSQSITDKDGNPINDKDGNKITKLNKILKKCDW